jgi:hypothetical protein
MKVNEADEDLEHDLRRYHQCCRDTHHSLATYFLPEDIAVLIVMDTPREDKREGPWEKVDKGEVLLRVIAVAESEVVIVAFFEISGLKLNGLR